MSDNLGDRQFFDAHPDQAVRRRRVVSSEVPRSLVGRDIREVEVRNIAPDILLLRFIDADASWPGMLPLFDSDLFLTPAGRQKIVACLNVMDGVSSFIASCARYDSEDQGIQ
jgi:hypothetical protein